jgi:hypothetical protein
LCWPPGHCKLYYIFFHITYTCVITFFFFFNFMIISFVNSPLEEFHPIASFFIITAWKSLVMP